MGLKLAIRAWMRRSTRLWSNVGLGARMTLTVLTGTVSLICLFAYLGTVALSENIQRTLQERVVLAQMTARHVDYLIANIRNGLTDSASRETWSDSSQVNVALERAYHHLNFSATQVFILDRTGHSIAAYPPIAATVSFGDFASVSAVLDGQPFAVSRYSRPLIPLAPSTIAAAPILDPNGQIIGALAMSINFANPNFRTFTYPIGLGETGYMDLIDRRGLILASTRPDRVGQESDHGSQLADMISELHSVVSACHDCHTAPSSLQPSRQVLAFAPLEQAQWGITVRQGEDEVFASIRQLQLRIFTLMTTFVAGDLILMYLTTRSVLVPVQALTEATRRITDGDLETPIAAYGRDEISTLARSFDAMRVRLKDSIEEIHSWNRELDAHVQERSAAYRTALEQKEQLRSELLRRVINAQEEERKRISRELHDETCQLLTGLAYALDNAAEANSLPEVRRLLEQMHALTKSTLEGVHRIIFDLRPSMLDSLGLVPALRWYADTRLRGMGCVFVIREIGEPRRLPPPVETAIFRVMQEVINNIAQHSQARHVDFVIDTRDGWADVRVTDDGIGFDPDRLMGALEGKQGLGLMGMRERMDAVGGELHLRSVPGGGTAVRLIVPLNGVAPDDGKEE
jgi:signal transduction histidine kinase